MGANEKHEAAMNGFIPATDEVRALYVAGTPAHRVSVHSGYAEFDRWLETVRAEAKAEALEEAVNGLDAIDPGGDSVYWDGTYYQRVNDWLRLRAEQIRNQS